MKRVLRSSTRAARAAGKKALVARPWQRPRPFNRASWQAAFSIMEIMVSLAALSVGLGAVMKLTSDQAKTLTYYESLMEIDSVFEEIRYVMANRDVCDATLQNQSVSGASITAIKKDSSNLFSTGTKYGALKRITLESITTGTPTGAHGSDEYALNFVFAVPKAAGSSHQFKIKRSLNFRARVSASKVVNCQSSSSAERQIEIWDHAEGSNLLSFLSSSAGSGMGKVILGQSTGNDVPLTLASGVGSAYSLDSPGGMLVGVPRNSNEVANVAYARAVFKHLSNQLDTKIQNFCSNHVYAFMKDGTRNPDAFDAYYTEGIRSCATPIGADYTPAFPAKVAATSAPSCSSKSAGQFVADHACCSKCANGCIQEYRFGAYHYYCAGGSTCSNSVEGMYCAGKTMTMTIQSLLAGSFCVHPTNFYEKTRLCQSRSAYCTYSGSTATITCNNLVPTAAPLPTSNICGSLSNGQYVENTKRCCERCPGKSCTTEVFTNRSGAKFNAYYCSSKPGSCSNSITGNSCNGQSVFSFSMANNAACKLICANSTLQGEGKALCFSRKVTCSCSDTTVTLTCSNS
ncbi:MAG: hypothetical protein J6Y94_06970 [Bacteriovoracaceae bacterium]|nr:hypothetical protein [Bacteriovoracaceae bacterium]